MVHAGCTFFWSRMPPAKPKTRPNAEDLSLWRKVAETVTPLRDRPPAPEVTAVLPQSRPAATPRIKAKLPNSRAVPPKPQVKEPLQTGRLADVDKRTGDRFRRGRMEIEAKLDLHGMTQERAHGVLRRFLFQAEGRGQRCVLVVTGKGRAGAGSGVLRRAVPLWLNDSDIRPIILAVTPAQQHHGGDGALYVLLRRRRER